MPVLSDALTAAGRWATALRRRNSKIRHWVPVPLIHRVNRLKSSLTEYRHLWAGVEYTTPVQNIYHCCFHKTGSQWIKSVLTDLDTYRYCGLSHFHHQSRRIGGADRRPVRDKTYPKGFPVETIVTPLYATYANFVAMPKPPEYRAFFVLRDPRDVVVSWYFSSRATHIMGNDDPAQEKRAFLQSASTEDGLKYAIDHWERIGGLRGGADWVAGAAEDPRVEVVRFEDLTGDAAEETFRALFEHLDIRMPADRLAALVESYSFRKLSGRKPGQENTSSHLRSGSGGTWRKHFTPEIEAYFEAKTGSLVEDLGYPA